MLKETVCPICEHVFSAEPVNDHFICPKCGFRFLDVESIDPNNITMADEDDEDEE